MEEVLKAAKLADCGDCDPLALKECVYSDGKTKFWPFFAPFAFEERLFQGVTSYLSEDYAFSERARMANPKRSQWFWSNPVLTHYGKYGYTMAEA